MVGAAHYTLKVLEVFRYFFDGRRSGIIRALTTDFAEFNRQCDPEKDGQCLVGLPNGTWEVNPHQMMVPHDLPEPVLGINFARYFMPEQEWAELVAADSDSWLLAVAFYVCGHFGFTKSEGDMLFQMINELPRVCKTVKEFYKPNDRSSTMMLKKPESCSSLKMSLPHKDESDHCGSSSYGQNKSSATYVNSSADDCGAQKDETGAGSSHGQILWNACE